MLMWFYWWCLNKSAILLKFLPCKETNSMNNTVKELSFKPGNIVTVVNKKDIMCGLQGEVVTTYLDDENTFLLLVVVRFHKKIVGDNRGELRLVGDYYEGIKSDLGPMTFTYQDKSPHPSSIRLDDGYTEENKQKTELK